MFSDGTYPGIEYRVMGLTDAKTGKALFTTRGCDAQEVLVTTRPIYPVTRVLEREWPVQVPLSRLPSVVTQAMYNTATLLLVSSFSLAVLSTGLVAREAVSVYKIPSRSMEPTILSGDLLLVEKVSPKVGVKPKSGEIVLFTPPPRLKEVVAATGGRVGPRDLFVKRVAATPGDRVRVDRGGNAYVNGEFYAEGQQCNLDFESDLLQNLIGAGGAGGEAEVPRDTSYVLGDCGDVSVDSRVWGPLEDAKVIGRPILRLWPPARFGPIADL